MMRNTIVGSIFFLVTFLSVTELQAASIAEVVGVRGEAWITNQDGSQTRLVLGSAVNEGTTLSTKEGGRVRLRFADGSVVVIGDSSVFSVEKFERGKDGKRSQAEMKLEIGLMNQIVTPGKDDSWRVTTPTVVTAVRGTEYLIEVKTDRTTEVNVVSGQVALNRATTPKRRTRSLNFESAANIESKESWLLKGQIGTTCNSEGCKDGSPQQAEHIRSITSRLAGV